MRGHTCPRCLPASYKVTLATSVTLSMNKWQLWTANICFIKGFSMHIGRKDLSACAQHLKFTLSLTCQQTNKKASKVIDKSPWMAASTETLIRVRLWEWRLAGNFSGDSHHCCKSLNVLKHVHKRQTEQRWFLRGSIWRINVGPRCVADVRH